VFHALYVVSCIVHACLACGVEKRIENGYISRNQSSISKHFTQIYI